MSLRNWVIADVSAPRARQGNEVKDSQTARFRFTQRAADVSRLVSRTMSGPRSILYRDRESSCKLHPRGYMRRFSLSVGQGSHE